MKTLEPCQWRHPGVFIANREHISSFVLIVEFEQENICQIHIEMTNTVEEKIRYITPYDVVFFSVNKIQQQMTFEYIPLQPYG